MIFLAYAFYGMNSWTSLQLFALHWSERLFGFATCLDLQVRVHCKPANTTLHSFGNFHLVFPFLSCRGGGFQVLFSRLIQARSGVLLGTLVTSGLHDGCMLGPNPALVLPHAVHEIILVISQLLLHRSDSGPAFLSHISRRLRYHRQSKSGSPIGSTALGSRHKHTFDLNRLQPCKFDMRCCASKNTVVSVLIILVFLCMVGQVLLKGIIGPEVRHRTYGKA